MKLITTCLLLLFLTNLNAQKLMDNFDYKTNQIQNNKLLIFNPTIKDLRPQKEFNLKLPASRSADFPMRTLLISTSIGLAVGIPLGIIRQVKKGSADCSRTGVTAHWTDCILGPHPLLRNILIWGGLGVTIGFSASF